MLSNWTALVQDHYSCSGAGSVWTGTKKIKDRVLKTEDMESLKVDPWKTLLDFSWLWKDFWDESRLAIA